MVILIRGPLRVALFLPVQSTSSVIVDWGPAGMEGSVEVVASNGCTSAFPVILSIDIGPLPVSSTPTGKSNVAQFTLGEPYSVLNEPGYTYTWTANGGSVASGQSTNSITVDWGAAGAGNLSVVGSNGCGSAAAVDIDVNIYDAIESVQTGNFGNNSTWSCNCIPLSTESIRVMPTHTVNLSGNETVAGVTIEPGGTLDLNGNNLIITGTYPFGDLQLELEMLFFQAALP